MALALALFEGSVIFAAMCAAILAWGRPHLVDWVDVAALLGRAFGLSLSLVAAFHIGDLYDLRVVGSFARFASRLPRSLALAVMLLVVLDSLLPQTGVPAVASLLVAVGLVLPLRAVSYRVVQQRPFGERVLIVGTSPLAWKIVEEIEARPDLRYAIVGVAGDASPAHEPPLGLPVLGPLEHLGKIIQDVRPERIIVALADRRGRLPVRELLEARVGSGVVVEEGVDVYERLTGKLAMEALAPSSLVFSRDFRKSRLALAVGRGVSVVAAVIGLVGLVPLFGLIALAIKLDSRGPVFFVQDRVGWCGKRFRLIKFRTMHPTTRTTSEWERDNSDRITRVGKWLRRFRLDELPQFVNIIRGDMNLVGPRPHPVSNFELFVLVYRNLSDISGQAIPYYALRCAVRPGLTGWAQVRYGYANGLDEETEKMRYDLYYVKHMSIWLDLRILFDTVKMVLSGRGSGVADVARTERAAGGVRAGMERAA